MPGDQRVHNPSSQHYKRLIPGFEARVLLPIRREPLGVVRIPYATTEGQARRGSLPDDANPYLAFAGADGRHRTASNKDPSGRRRWTEPLTTCRRRKLADRADRLGVAPRALKQPGRPITTFLLKGGRVHAKDMIEGYLEAEAEECTPSNTRPHR